MVTVNNDFCIGKAALRDAAEMRIHITDKILNILTIFKFAEICFSVLLFSIWENIEDGFIFRICQNSLVLFSAGITFEFINGEYFR